MNFLDSFFGKKQPVPPEATKLQEVITAMCAKPGPTNDKSSRSAPFYALLPTSRIPKDVADLFVDVTTFTTVFLIGPDTRESMAALEKLCSIKGKVVSNLLYCIANMSDSEQSIPVVGLTSSSMFSTRDTHKASFEPQRRLARAELAKRGSPKYDMHHYAVE